MCAAVRLWLFGQCHVVTESKYCSKHQNKFKIVKKKSHHYNVIYPRSTRNTAVRVHGVPRCGKSNTRDTRFGNTAGKPVPVIKPKRRSNEGGNEVKRVKRGQTNAGMDKHGNKVK